MLSQNYRQALKAASEFQMKALLAETSKDAGAFMVLAEQASDIAIRLHRELSTNSILVFFEIHDDRGYRNYREFCARNNFEFVSETDFDSALLKMRT